jgi:hypothetical protein
LSSGDAEMGCRAAGVVPPGVATLGALPERRRKGKEGWGAGPDGVRVRLPLTRSWHRGPPIFIRQER